MPENLLLTGPPGIGKTTIIRTVARALGARAGGFYTEEVREEDRRVGFRIVTLDGQTAWLARIGLGSRYRVGRYGVDIRALENVGVGAIHRALAFRRVLIIDEIGRMELYSPAFVQALTAAFDSPKPLVATIMDRPHPSALLFKTRGDVIMWAVTHQNRSQLPARVLEWVQNRLSASTAEN